MRTVLIVTDMQNGFMNEYTKPIISRIKRLLERKLFNHVVFTKFVNLPESLFVKLLDYEKLQKEPETNIINELQSYVVKVFPKHGYTPFTKDFVNFLKIEKITHLYFVGVDTNICVEKGAVDAFERGYIPFVLGYYCASHSGREFHDFALKNLEKLIGKKQVIDGEIKKI